jgi:hypothetical protein
VGAQLICRPWVVRASDQRADRGEGVPVRGCRRRLHWCGGRDRGGRLNRGSCMRRQQWRSDLSPGIAWDLKRRM